LASRSPAGGGVIQRVEGGLGGGGAAPGGGGGGGSGLPGPLKAGIESLSGLSMDDVSVRYGSSEPASVGALAYAKGNDIHLGPGQEQHLPHEAWHVVQQKQGRVAPQVQMKGAGGMNTSGALEAEADAMGAKAAQLGASGGAEASPVVSKAPSGGGVIQRYVEDPDLAPGMVSDGGHLAVTGQLTAWASDEKIDAARDALAATTSRITLEKGAAFAPPKPASWQAAFGDRKLYRVTPVYKANAAAHETAHEPVDGEAAQVRAQKLAAYKASLTAGIGEIDALSGELVRAWRAAEANYTGFLGSVRFDPPGSIIHGNFLGRIVALITRTMGAAWTADAAARPVINPAAPAALKLEAYMHLFGALRIAFTTRVADDFGDESAITELTVGLPNDCKVAAMLLTGKGAAALSEANDNPDIGGNYYTAFGTHSGWNTHYATVIAKDTTGDNTDNLTFEAAADQDAKLEKGKTLGFFEMYGTEIPAESFDYRIRDKQRAYIDRITEGELASAETDEEREAIRGHQAADHAKLSAKQKELLEHGDSD
jgi:hypothetical protein